MESNVFNFSKKLDFLLKYLNLIKKITLNPNEKITEDESHEYHDLLKDILGHLMEKPSDIILVNDLEIKKLINNLIKETWEYFDEFNFIDDFVEIFDQYSEENMMQFIDKTKMLKPTYINISPEKTTFYNFYNESIECWRRNLNNASVLVASTAVESVLYEVILEDKNHSENFKSSVKLKSNKNNSTITAVDFTFSDLINYANKSHLFSYESNEMTHTLRKRRNKIVHEGKIVTSSEAYESIMTMKNIVCDLFTNVYVK